MTREESKTAILAAWNRLPAWKRRSTSDAAEFTQIMLTSRPDLTDFECPFERFLVIRAWLMAEQRATEKTPTYKRRAITPRAKAALELKPV